MSDTPNFAAHLRALAQEGDLATIKQVLEAEAREGKFMYRYKTASGVPMPSLAIQEELASGGVSAVADPDGQFIDFMWGL